MKNSIKFVSFGLCCSLLSACETLPAAGPKSMAETKLSYNSNGKGLSYAVVPLTPQVLQSLPQQSDDSLSQSFGRQTQAPRLSIGIGDTVGVTVFEAAGGGLFVSADASGRQGNFVTIPQQQVDQSGNITVPFAGTIRAAGRTPAAIKQDVEDRLGSRAIEPNAVVSIIEHQANAVSVLGEVNEPIRFKLLDSNTRVLDALAEAKGPKFADYDTFVTLQRGERKVKVLLKRITGNPKENIFVYPGDDIYVSHEPRYFLSFGASGSNGRYPIDEDQLTLGDALGVSGGLQDQRADASSVLVYRMVPRKDVAATGAPLPPNLTADVVPTIYIVDLRSPEGYFLAQHFAIQNRDLVYVSTSKTVDLLKVIEVFGATGNAAYPIKQTL